MFLKQTVRTPTIFTIDAPNEQFVHKDTQFCKQANRVNSAGSHRGRDLINGVRHRIKRRTLRLDKIIHRENNPPVFFIILNGHPVSSEVSIQEKAVLVQCQQMRIAVLAGIGYGIVQCSTDAYIPAASSILQTFRMADTCQRNPSCGICGRIVPQKQFIHLRQVAVDIPDQVLARMIEDDNGKQSHCAINEG